MKRGSLCSAWRLDWLGAGPAQAAGRPSLIQGRSAPATEGSPHPHTLSLTAGSAPPSWGARRTSSAAPPPCGRGSTAPPCATPSSLRHAGAQGSEAGPHAPGWEKCVAGRAGRQHPALHRLPKVVGRSRAGCKAGPTRPTPQPPHPALRALCSPGQSASSSGLTSPLTMLYLAVKGALWCAPWSLRLISSPASWREGGWEGPGVGYGGALQDCLQ